MKLVNWEFRQARRRIFLGGRGDNGGGKQEQDVGEGGASNTRRFINCSDSRVTYFSAQPDIAGCPYFRKQQLQPPPRNPLFPAGIPTTFSLQPHQSLLDQASNSKARLKYPLNYFSISRLTSGGKRRCRDDDEEASIEQHEGFSLTSIHALVLDATIPGEIMQPYLQRKTMAAKERASAGM